MSQEPQRIHFLDNLRALAMLLGVVFHAALAYSPTVINVWPSSGGESSQILSAAAWFTHLWRMPLFFMISGFFAMLLLRRRGIGAFLKNRTLRIALPFIIFMPLVLLGIIAGMGWAMQTVENPGPMLRVIIGMAGNEHAADTPFSTAHLWFLYQLFQFCVVLAVLFRLGLMNHDGLRLLMHPVLLLGLVPLTLVPALLYLPSPHPAPEQLMPQAWPFGFYGVFFFLGAVLHDHRSALTYLQRMAIPLFLLAIPAYAIVWSSYPQNPSLSEMEATSQTLAITGERVALSTLSAYIAVFVTAACLGAGGRWLTYNSRVMRYITDASYWVYIVHLPLVFAIQYTLMDVQWGVWSELLVTLVATLSISMLTYATLVRWTPIGKLLNGKRVPLRSPHDEKRWDRTAKFN